MIIYPAVDIKDGRCVRLVQGEFDKVTIYSEDPVEMALKWEGLGAEYLHVVDLDGARTGETQNISITSEIASKVKMPIQLGGGIRSIEIIEKVISKGIQRVILGTSAVKNPDLVKKAIEIYKEKIVIGIDAKDGMVAIDGWENTSDFTAIDFASKMVELGAKTIIYTDIARDGMLTGPNLIAMREMAQSVDAEIIASGGVSSLKDIKDLKETGVSGVIVGKALYTGDLDLKEAIKIGKE
ncbi:MAG TPA: 1-(5-phosphoribosyl)-5-[(5-phosphoribosylamino)methylideneamino]imidazole-4-carboxamide isomerase [Clostridium sp.]|jgi:phosphoribosylformimino-5-aminoimidazole carboxamide ribotide isomerase|nr:1-(5-phosphoribosyl)-5-[(5-phosphoribosylamino)methylideneamino]imidazole-4-carboxamide isomerase [Clostridium sp.]